MAASAPAMPMGMYAPAPQQVMPQNLNLRMPKPPRIPPPVDPNHTLYVHNLNEKINLEALKKSLRVLFQDYGQVLDIVVGKSIVRRGQAFIVFREVESATKALKEVQGFPLYGKPMDIQYARGKSDAIAKLDGSLEEQKRKRAEEKAQREKDRVKKPKTEPSSAPPTAPAATKPYNPAYWKPDLTTPSKVLFVEGLPDDTADVVLVCLFKQFDGFLEVRLVSGKNVAFVEYDNELQATYALQQLQAFKIAPDHPLRISFRR
ncbi:hypothetical protein SeMB42_g07937 [Synchytrium endobioticum]|uniref:RRM domain-containing protein n=1 Tax=Synchytrium endobioticum TaxID=286115 RepID=A0A507BT34_9FUNG|nr:hypothetical protein SeMB42_g07937 [Synchytrium endobioticum]TPX43366.1 hypothetical protein SeLEV6574_g05112 [Synchytrium endobioticum]